MSLKNSVIFLLTVLFVFSINLSDSKASATSLHTKEVLPITGKIYTPNVSSLNLRTGPGVNYKKAGIVKSGELLEELSTKKVGKSTWSKVKYKGKSYYVNKSYLKASSSKTTSKASTSSNKVSSNIKYKANHIYYGSKAIPYKNTGMGTTIKNGKKDWIAQGVIDKTNNAATFGGAATFSGTDKKNTHFIGHNPGQFSGMHNQTIFIVTDSAGNAFTYKRTSLYIVNEYGVDIKTKKDKWNRITGKDGGERIVLQSTKNHPTKYIVEAELIKSEFKKK